MRAVYLQKKKNERKPRLGGNVLISHTCVVYTQSIHLSIIGNMSRTTCKFIRMNAFFY